MQKISPFLWFNKNAEEAVKLYTSLIKGSKIGVVTRYGKEGFDVHHMPAGTAMTVNFTLGGMNFTALNGGPAFKANPSISFHIKCKTTKEVDAIWEKLLPGSKILMKLDKYPFSGRYGWIQDKYGVSWQVIHAGGKPITQTILPVLMFTGKLAGKTEEAVKHYVSLFKNSKITLVSRYGKGMLPDREGTINYAGFLLERTEFGAMDSAREHRFTFNEAISFVVSCKNQDEVDYYWESLSADPNAGQCGWLKDKYGVSWQVTPTRLGELLGDKDPVKAGRVMNAMLPMKKIDIQTLEKAYKG